VRRAIFLALFLSGCAGGVETEVMTAAMPTGSITPSADAAVAAGGELRQAQQRAVDQARKPLQAFLAEKGSNCSSPKLKEAATRTTETASAMATALRPEYEALLAIGAAVLDVADGAKSKGCHAQAKRLYEFVLKNFSGLGYAALRDRATAGAKGLPVAS
jgi:hypothetical protein